MEVIVDVDLIGRPGPRRGVCDACGGSGLGCGMDDGGGGGIREEC